MLYRKRFGMISDHGEILRIIYVGEVVGRAQQKELGAIIGC
jgi:hypothetical protein